MSRGGAITLGVFLLLALVIVLVHESATRDLPAAWCSGSTQALRDAVDQHVADIGLYSPGQPVDRHTLELDLLAECGR